MIECLAAIWLRCVTHADAALAVRLEPGGEDARLEERWGSQTYQFGGGQKWAGVVETAGDGSVLVEAWATTAANVISVARIDGEDRPVCRHLFRSVADHDADLLLDLEVTADSGTAVWLITFRGWMVGIDWLARFSVARIGVSATREPSIEQVTAPADGVAQVLRLTLALGASTQVTAFGEGAAFAETATQEDLESFLTAIDFHGELDAFCSVRRRDLFGWWQTLGTDGISTVDWSEQWLWLDLLDWRRSPDRADLPTQLVTTGGANYSGAGRGGRIRFEPGEDLAAVIDVPVHPDDLWFAPGVTQDRAEASAWQLDLPSLKHPVSEATAQARLLIYETDAGWSVWIAQQTGFSGGWQQNIDQVVYQFDPAPGSNWFDPNRNGTYEFAFARMFARILETDADAPPIGGEDVLDMSGMSLSLHVFDAGDDRPAGRQWLAQVSGTASGSIGCGDCQDFDGEHVLSAAVSGSIPSSWSTREWASVAGRSVISCADGGLTYAGSISLWNRLDATGLVVDALGEDPPIHARFGDPSSAWFPADQLLIVATGATSGTGSRREWHLFETERPVRLDDSIDTVRTFTYRETITETTGTAPGGSCGLSGATITLRPGPAVALPAATEFQPRRTPGAWRLEFRAAGEVETADEQVGPVLWPCGERIWSRTTEDWTRWLDESAAGAHWTFSPDEGLSFWSLDAAGGRTLVCRWRFAPNEAVDTSGGDLWSGLEMNAAAELRLVRLFTGPAGPAYAEHLPAEVVLVPLANQCPAGSREFRWRMDRLGWSGLSPCAEAGQTAQEPTPAGGEDLEVRDGCCEELRGSAIIVWLDGTWQALATDCEAGSSLVMPVDDGEAEEVRWIQCTADDPDPPPPGDCDWISNDGTTWSPDGTHSCLPGWECREPEAAPAGVGDQQPGECVAVDCDGQGCVWFGLGTGVGIQSWIMLENDCPAHCGCPAPGYNSTELGELYEPDCVCSPGQCDE